MDFVLQISSTDKEQIYIEILPQISEVIKGEENLIANLANVVAIIKNSFKEISWVGFYLWNGKELVLGPFQGKPACTRIKLGQGVCGTSVQKRKTIIVPDVSKFPGHIYCDPDSKSEIVVPIIKDENIIGVLDADSADINTFDKMDEKYLIKVTELVSSIF
jgi:GAF domain-containing protein